MPAKIDLTGQTFGRLTVIEEAGRVKSRHTLWLCRCTCGDKKVVWGIHLKSGHTQSCGCIKREQLSNMTKSHGMAGTRFYNIWSSMKQRTLNPNNHAYVHYGARGIILCPRWHDFENFKSDMYESYLEHAAEHGEHDTTLERINNDVRYTPWNCRWATRAEQARNTRRTKRKTEPTDANQNDSEIKLTEPIVNDNNSDSQSEVRA